jgi:hypothetical protein
MKTNGKEISQSRRMRSILNLCLTSYAVCYFSAKSSADYKPFVSASGGLSRVSIQSHSPSSAKWQPSFTYQFACGYQYARDSIPFFVGLGIGINQAGHTVKLDEVFVPSGIADTMVFGKNVLVKEGFTRLFVPMEFGYKWRNWRIALGCRLYYTFTRNSLMHFTEYDNGVPVRSTIKLSPFDTENPYFEWTSRLSYTLDQNLCFGLSYLRSGRDFFVVANKDLNPGYHSVFHSGMFSVQYFFLSGSSNRK